MLSELQIAEFAARFSGRDKKILEMKMEGHTAQEIAEAVGYQTHSAVPVSDTHLGVKKNRKQSLWNALCASEEQWGCLFQ